MTTFLLVVILVSIAAVAILVVYLIDRVNTLQRLTRLMQPDPSGSTISEFDQSGPFGDLSGERLWDALSGVPTEGWDHTALELVRNRYALVLRKHVEDLFHEGLIHGQANMQQVPSPSRSIKTLRGTVDSWIPVELAMTLYKCGLDRAKATPETLAGIRTILDAAVQGLFDTVRIKLQRPLSEHLIPTDLSEMPPLAVPQLEQSAQPSPSATPPSLPIGQASSPLPPQPIPAPSGVAAKPEAQAAQLPAPQTAEPNPPPSMFDMLTSKQSASKDSPVKPGS